MRTYISPPPQAPPLRANVGFIAALKLATAIGFGWVRQVWADSAYKAHALFAWIKPGCPATASS